MDQVIELVDRDTQLCRVDDEYRIPASKLRSIVEVAYLAARAEYQPVGQEWRETEGAVR